MKHADIPGVLFATSKAGRWGDELAMPQRMYLVKCLKY